MLSEAHTRMTPRARRENSITASRQAPIVARIRAALENHTRINLHRYPIVVRFDGEDLALTGEVADVAAKKTALELAATIAPAARIVDRLRVRPAQPMGDREIRDHVIKVLLQEPALEHCLLYSRLPKELASHRRGIPEPTGSIVIEVSDGVVTLNGEVPSLSHKRLAGVLAWWVPGCRDVINGLEEVPLEQDNDAELTDAVRLVLEKDPFINATKIRVTAKNWLVTLNGLVPNQTMKQMAERDVWYVLGVKNVVNNLQTKW
jgi:osmotically-inducible protein OsmY